MAYGVNNCKELDTSEIHNFKKQIIISQKLKRKNQKCDHTLALGQNGYLKEILLLLLKLVSYIQGLFAFLLPMFQLAPFSNIYICNTADWYPSCPVYFSRHFIMTEETSVKMTEIPPLHLCEPMRDQFCGWGGWKLLTPPDWQ